MNFASDNWAGCAPRSPLRSLPKARAWLLPMAPMR